MLVQVAAACGALVVLGAIVVARGLSPVTPDLRSALARLDTPPPATGHGGASSPVVTTGLEGWVGRWLYDRVGDHPSLRIPKRDLAVLQQPTQSWLGQKALLAAIGLAFPSLMTVVVGTVGLALPVALPAAGSLVLAAVLWFVPDIDARARAVTARAEFARAVTAYIDLTALERAGGTGTTQALENAAQIGGSWVFERLREALNRARWSGATPWAQLSALGEELGVPELDDLADIIRLSGEEGVAVYDNLRARSRSMRTAMLSREQAQANADSERMVIPVALLGLLFLCLLAYPAIVRVL